MGITPFPHKERVRFSDETRRENEEEKFREEKEVPRCAVPHGRQGQTAMPNNG